MHVTRITETHYFGRTLHDRPKNTNIQLLFNIRKKEKNSNRLLTNKLMLHSVFEMLFTVSIPQILWSS
jgi:hypothetical protein